MFDRSPVRPLLQRDRLSLLGGALLLVLGLGAVACEGPIEFAHTTSFKVVLNTANKFEGEPGTPVEAEVPPVPIFYGLDVDLAAQNPELVDYSEGGLFTETRVDQVKYTVTMNTLNADLQNITLAVGPTGTVDPSAEGAFRIANIAEIKSMETPSGDAEIFPENGDQVATQLQTLMFGVASGTELGVEAGDPVPQGFVQIDIEMLLTLVADPL